MLPSIVVGGSQSTSAPAPSTGANTDTDVDTSSQSKVHHHTRKSGKASKKSTALNVRNDQQGDADDSKKASTGDTKPDRSTVDNSAEVGTGDALSAVGDQAQPGKEQIPKLKWGNIAFNHPSTMQLGQSTTIYAVLSPDKTAKALGSSMAGNLTPDGTVQTKPVQYSTLMRAILSGEGVKISGDKDTSTQTVGYVPGLDTQWVWDVTPITPGKHTLHLRVAAVLQVAGQEREQEIAVLNEDIVVNVTLSRRIHDFVTDNWQWLWTAVVIPIGSWTALKLHKKRKHKPT